MNPCMELHGLQHHGQPFDYVWQWPPTIQRVHFEDILRLCPQPDLALMPHLDACSLHRSGGASQTCWWVSTQSMEIACSLNGLALVLDASQELCDGDILEVGLYRFRVHIPVVEENEHSPHHDFRLTDLDAIAHESFAVASTTGQSHSDFGDLISLALEPTPSQPTALASQSAAPVTDAGVQAHSPASSDPLELLHAQYLRKLRDPAYTGDDAVWQGLVQTKEASRDKDAFDELVQQCKTSNSLEDLLGQSRSIDHVLAGLGTMSTTDVLAPEPFDSVIHLFAPQDLQPQANSNLAANSKVEDTLARLVQSSLPGLTLREHHSLSLDSAMLFLLPKTPPVPTPHDHYPYPPCVHPHPESTPPRAQLA